MNENGRRGRVEHNSVENGKGFKKRGGDIRAIIGPKDRRREGGVRGFKDYGIATRGIEDRAIRVNMASPDSGRGAERL